MSDLVIRGMEMPKYTTKAEFGIDADGNPLCMVYHEDGTEPYIYDVLHLPEGHGRLIDVDAPIRVAYFDGTIHETTPSRIVCKHSLLDFPKTIVPEEGGREDA